VNQSWAGDPFATGDGLAVDLAYPDLIYYTRWAGPGGRDITHDGIVSATSTENYRFAELVMPLDENDKMTEIKSMSAVKGHLFVGIGEVYHVDTFNNKKPVRLGLAQYEVESSSVFVEEDGSISLYFMNYNPNYPFKAYSEGWWVTLDPSSFMPVREPTMFFNRTLGIAGGTMRVDLVSRQIIIVNEPGVWLCQPRGFNECNGYGVNAVDIAPYGNGTAVASTNGEFHKHRALTRISLSNPEPGPVVFVPQPFYWEYGMGYVVVAVTRGL